MNVGAVDEVPISYFFIHYEIHDPLRNPTFTKTAYTPSAPGGQILSVRTDSKAYHS